MRSHRAEFPKSVREAAFQRSGGRCECGCGLLIRGTPHYDHFPVAAALGGPATLENCRVLDPAHHRQITAEKDVPVISKSQRVYEKRLGLRTTKRGFRKAPPGYDPWTRSMRREGD